MIEKYDPDNILIALIHLKDFLPIFVGDDWPNITDQIDYNLNQLRNNSDEEKKRDSAIALVEMLENYKDAFTRLRSELEAVNISRNQIFRNFDVKAKELNLSEEQLNHCVTIILQTLPPEIQNYQTKHIRLKPFGIGGATSIKLNNIDLSIFQISSLSAVTITTTIAVAADPKPLLIAMGVLTMALELAKAVNKDIDEQEASVYWGFILARDEKWSANQDTIISFSNRARKAIGFKILEENEVLNSLNKLRSMKAVEKIPHTKDMWHIKESFSIK